MSAPTNFLKIFFLRPSFCLPPPPLFLLFRRFSFQNPNNIPPLLIKICRSTNHKYKRGVCNYYLYQFINIIVYKLNINWQQQPADAMFPVKKNSTSKKVEENVSQPLSQIPPHLKFFRTFPSCFKFQPPPSHTHIRACSCAPHS